jgi:hypothetical protein
MGPPKSFKTGAVVGSYPKPMLYMQFDREGISVVPSKGAPPGSIPMDTFIEDVIIAKPTEVPSFLAKPTAEQPRILCVDFTLNMVAPLANDFKPPAYSQPFLNFLSAYNHIVAFIGSGKPLPWATVVLDSVTGFEDIILNHISSVNPNAMSDARQWAGMTGGKVRQTLLSLCGWPCHVVAIMHSMIDKNELTGLVMELPNVFSGLRNDIGGLFSQFFYQVKNNGTPVIWPHDKMYVRGIGSRWPANLPSEVKPDFNSIYGKEI